MFLKHFYILHEPLGLWGLICNRCSNLFDFQSFQGICCSVGHFDPPVGIAMPQDIGIVTDDDSILFAFTVSLLILSHTTFSNFHVKFRNEIQWIRYCDIAQIFLLTMTSYCAKIFWILVMCSKISLERSGYYFLQLNSYKFHSQFKVCNQCWYFCNNLTQI